MIKQHATLIFIVLLTVVFLWVPINGGETAFYKVRKALV